MENINLFILRLILTAVLLSVVAGKKTKETSITSKNEHTSEIVPHHHHNQKHHDFYLKPRLDTPKHLPKNKRSKGVKKSKKAKRDAYGRYGKWSARSSNYGYGENGEFSSHLPLYLVYNRKMGAYYPFYKYPKENHVRRSSNYRRVPLE